MSHYFFLGNTKVIHTRSVETIFGIVSRFGGLASAVFSVFWVIGNFVNSKLFMSYLIEDIYTVKHFSAGKSKLEQAEHDEKTQKRRGSRLAKCSHNAGDKQPEIGPNARRKRRLIGQATMQNVILKTMFSQVDKGLVIKFSLKDKFAHVTRCLRTICGFARKCKFVEQKDYMSFNEMVYMKGHRIVDKQLDINQIVKSINKMKASIQAIIMHQDDPQLV